MFVSLRRAIHLAPRGHFGTAINVSAASSVGIPQRLRENAASCSAFCGTALCRSGVDGVERHLSLIYGQSVMDLLPGMARSSPQKNSFASPPKMFRGRRRTKGAFLGLLPAARPNLSGQWELCAVLLNCEANSLDWWRGTIWVWPSLSWMAELFICRRRSMKVDPDLQARYFNGEIYRPNAFLSRPFWPPTHSPRAIHLAFVSHSPYLSSTRAGSIPKCVNCNRLRINSESFIYRYESILFHDSVAKGEQ